MAYGWIGKSLEVNLSEGKVERYAVDEELFDTYLGGKGIAAKILWDRVPPEVDPFSPDNILVFAPGLLAGTLAPGAAKGTVVSRSPLTGNISRSAMGGHWSAELKNAGYDFLVISGKSPTLVYLWINDDTIELRDASHLWGQDTYKTQESIRKELGNPSVQIICIGTPGEKKVFSAAIQHGMESSASRGGIGAVMGDKRLKAVAIHGTKDINIAEKAKFIESCSGLLEKLEPIKQSIAVDNVGMFFQHHLAAMGAFGNFGEDPPPGLETVGEAIANFSRKFKVRERSCFNCPIACKGVFSGDDPVGEELMTFKCESWVTFASLCKKFDFVFNAKCASLCNRLGLDVHSTAAAIAFSIDLYEKGILSKTDTDGLDLKWGDEAVVYTLINKIANREGFGTLFANGVYEAARKIGRGAENLVHHVKKLEMGHYQVYRKLLALEIALSDTGCMFKAASAQAIFFMDAPRLLVEAHVQQGLLPEELLNYINDVDYRGKAKIVEFYEPLFNAADMLGFCVYMIIFPFAPLTLSIQASLASLATGRNIDQEKLTRISERVTNLVRAYNVRCGSRREDDTVPEKYFREAPSSPKRGEKLDHGKFDEMLDEAYALRGWNKEGIPTQEKLDGLGLHYVREDLQKRGIRI